MTAPFTLAPGDKMNKITFSKISLIGNISPLMENTRYNENQIIFLSHFDRAASNRCDDRNYEAQKRIVSRL